MKGAITKDDVIARVRAKTDGIVGNAYDVTQPIEMRFNELITGVRADLAIKIFGADRVFSNENLEGALKRAIDDAKRPLSDDSVGIVVTGSVVTVGEARSILRRLFSKED